MAETTIGEEEITNRNISPVAAIDPLKMAQRVLSVHPIRFTDFRVWDANATSLPATGGTDDLGLYTGTWGTDPSYVGTGDVKAAGCTRYALAFVPIPPNWDSVEPGTVVVRLYAGMKTTVADGSAVIDVEAWRIDKDGTLGAADICATAQQSINSLTAAAKDFEITGTSLSKGDILAVRIKIVIVDTATATAVIGAVWAAELCADLKG